jgi:hypothetical protein
VGNVYLLYNIDKGGHVSGKSAKKLRKEYQKAVHGITEEAMRLVIDDLAKSRGRWRVLCVVLMVLYVAIGILLYKFW